MLSFCCSWQWTLETRKLVSLIFNFRLDLSIQTFPKQRKSLFLFFENCCTSCPDHCPLCPPQKMLLLKRPCCGCSDNQIWQSQEKFAKYVSKLYACNTTVDYNLGHKHVVITFIDSSTSKLNIWVGNIVRCLHNIFNVQTLNTIHSACADIKEACL